MHICSITCINKQYYTEINITFIFMLKSYNMKVLKLFSLADLNYKVLWLFPPFLYILISHTSVYFLFGWFRFVLISKQED